MKALFQRALRGGLAAALVAMHVLGSAARAQSDGKLLAPPPPRASVPAATSTSPDRSPPLLPTARPNRDSSPVVTADSRSGLKISKGQGILPNAHGQVWREYDIS